jgi:hypothetical protein
MILHIRGLQVVFDRRVIRGTASRLSLRYTQATGDHIGIVHGISRRAK